ncbi:hypothetical protein ACP70R_004581 [Stipagrostis hirtigluma subsp. patula]
MLDTTAFLYSRLPFSAPTCKFAALHSQHLAFSLGALPQRRFPSAGRRRKLPPFRATRLSRAEEEDGNGGARSSTRRRTRCRTRTPASGGSRPWCWPTPAWAGSPRAKAMEMMLLSFVSAEGRVGDLRPADGAHHQRRLRRDDYRGLPRGTSSPTDTAEER